MELSTDAKFGIGVLLTTVLIIGGAAWYGSTSEPASNTPVVVDQPERLVREDDPVLGASDAQVTVVEFGDFQCPSCGALHPVLKQIKEQNQDKPVRFVYRQFPLTQIHDRALEASEASMAAQAQGKFWEYHDKLFENQRNLSNEDLQRYAQELGLNMDEFRAALDDGRFIDQIEQDIEDGRALGVAGTPTLFINNTAYRGTYSATELQSVIDSHLQAE